MLQEIRGRFAGETVRHAPLLTTEGVSCYSFCKVGMAKTAQAKRANGGDAVAAAQAAMLDGVGREIAASFPGITRLGGQIVAALYLAERSLSMDELSEQLGRSKSNIFANLRGLEAAGIVERQRASGTRHDTFALRGKYPDVVVGAYLARLRRVVIDKVNLCNRALDLLGDARGEEADRLRTKLTALLKKYERFTTVFAELVPVTEGPVDLEELIDNMPSAVMGVISGMARRALGLTPRNVTGEKKTATRR